MSRAVALRLGAFAGVLALAFAGAFAIGSAVDPIAAAERNGQDGRTGMDGMGGMTTPAPGDHEAGPGGPADGDGHDTEPDDGHGHGGGSTDAGAQPPGLAVAQSGYTLSPATTFFEARKQTQLRFTIQGPDGKPVTRYTRSHEKDLHLIVVRRDLSGFHHVHPTMAADGTWSIPFTFTAGGTWRLYADFRPAALGTTLTLGTDVNVSGLYIPVPPAEPAAVSSVDGYDVTLAGTPVAGKESELTFTVSRGGKPVADLEPYLGAFGHLVSLRGGDLAYLHTHPAQEATAGTRGGPGITFATTFPTAGTYSLYLDFQHAGKVRTAEFTVTVDGRPIVAPKTLPAATPGHDATPHGHGEEGR